MCYYILYIYALIMYKYKVLEPGSRSQLPCAQWESSSP